MTLIFDATRIDAIREASRRLVRAFGFMGGRFAGTDLSPSAVHALVEIEGVGITARELGERLNLEKSSVSRMLRKLVDAGDVSEYPGEDGRVKRLSLTSAGRRRVAAIHDTANAQVSGALSRLERGQDQLVLDGLNLYATALGAPAAIAIQRPAVEITSGYRVGMIARITQMHALYYARLSGFGQAFESGVAGGLAEFCGRLESSRNAIWVATAGQEIVGSIAMDGEDLGGNAAHLRWFFVDERVRGSGVGHRLLSEALCFADAQGFAETHLWTFSGLSAARHLYETHRFVLKAESTGAQWGAEVLEQLFVRPAS